MTRLPKTLLTPLFGATLSILAVYSYSQIDLNLTLSSNPTYQIFQEKLIFLGYFNRPLSASLFLMIVILLFAIYIQFLRQARAGKIKVDQVIKLALLAAVILLFSYPAFSHDIFNYIFDARLPVTHRVSPWDYTALDFPQDLWTRFMRWTHRTYPYGPVWLAITIPFYVAGLGKFTLTLFWFKVLGALSYLGSVWLIKKLSLRLHPQQAAFSLAFFALNPLILIESLVSAHLDGAMSTLLLLALFVRIVPGKRLLAMLVLFLSAGVKFVTLGVIPVWIWWESRKQDWKPAISVMVVGLTIAILGAILTREVLPWYIVPPLALIALLPDRKSLTLVSIGLCLGLLLRYWPFLLRGEYSAWVRRTRDILTLAPLLIITAMLLWRRRQSTS